MSLTPTRLNEWAFALDAALGELPQKEIARKHGISTSYTSDLIHGKRRPHVARLIDELKAECKRDAKLRLAKLQDQAVTTLGKALKDENKVSNTALAAAKELLNRTLGSDWLPERPETEEQWIGPSLLDLSEATKRLVLKELGGPLE